MADAGVALTSSGSASSSGGDATAPRPLDGLLARVIGGKGRHGNGIVCCLALAPNGKIIYAGASDGTLRAWDMTSGCLLAGVSDAHSDWIRCMKLSSDGTFLFTGSRDSDIKVWSTTALRTPVERAKRQKTKEETASTSTGIGTGTGCTAGSSADAALVTPLRLVKTLKGHTDWVRCLDLLENAGECLLVSGSDDGTIKAWDCKQLLSGNSALGKALEEDVPSRDVYLHKEWIRSIIICSKANKKPIQPDHRPVTKATYIYIAAGNLAHKVKISDGTITRSFVGHRAAVTCMCLHTYRCRRRHANSSQHCINHRAGEYSIYEWLCEEEECNEDDDDQGCCASGPIKCSLDTLFTGSDDRTVRQWCASNGQCTRIFCGHQDWVRSISVSRLGKTLFATSQDKFIRCWPLHPELCFLEEGEDANYNHDTLFESLGLLGYHEDAVWDSAIANDGMVMATAGADAAVKVWLIDVPHGNRDRSLMNTNQKQYLWTPETHYMFPVRFKRAVRHLLLLHKHCTVSEPDSPLAVLANSHQELYRIIAYLADITLKDLAKRGKNTE